MSTEPYVLHKQALQLDTLAVVQFLHHVGRPCTPYACVERNHPDWVYELPSIETVNRRYVGIGECVRFWEKASGISDLLDQAVSFKDRHPAYTIASDHCSHPSM